MLMFPFYHPLLLDSIAHFPIRTRAGVLHKKQPWSLCEHVSCDGRLFISVTGDSSRQRSDLPYGHHLHTVTVGFGQVPCDDFASCKVWETQCISSQYTGLLLASPCTLSHPTAYLFCIPHFLEALSIFRAELPSETGTRLRRAVQDLACAPCRVFVFFTPALALHAYKMPGATISYWVGEWVVRYAESLVDVLEHKNFA
jgi:hypothetical protein